MLLRSMIKGPTWTAVASSAAAAMLMAAGASAQQLTEGQAAPLTVAGLPGFALRDGAFDMPNDGKAFVLGVPVSVTSGLLRSHRLPRDKFAFSLQPLLVRNGRRVLLFDTGAGPNMGPGAGHLLSSLARAGVRPDEVTDIFISHGHGDHVGGLVAPDGRLTFPNAAVHMSRQEWRWLSGMSERQAAGFFIKDHRRLVAAVAPKLIAFAPGSMLLPGVVRAVDISGHSPGHSAYMIGSGRGAVLFVGDAMHHSVASVVHPEWLIAFDGDKQMARRSRVAGERSWARTGQRLYLGHFPYPGYGRIVRRGQSYAWLPLS